MISEEGCPGTRRRTDPASKPAGDGLIAQQKGAFSGLGSQPPTVQGLPQGTKPAQEGSAHPRARSRLEDSASPRAHASSVRTLRPGAPSAPGPAGRRQHAAGWPCPAIPPRGRSLTRTGSNPPPPPPAPRRGGVLRSHVGSDGRPREMPRAPCPRGGTRAGRPACRSP